MAATKKSPKKSTSRPATATGKAAARKKTAAKKTAVRKKPVAKKKPAVKKTAAKKKTAATKKTAAKKKPVAKKKAATKAPAKKTAVKKKTGSGEEDRGEEDCGQEDCGRTAKKTTATKAPAKKAPTKKGAAEPSEAPVSRATVKGTPMKLVRPPAKPTHRVRAAKLDKKMLKQIRETLEAEQADLRRQLDELDSAAHESSQTEATGEAGMNQDFADAGTATFDRERDFSIRNNIQDLVDQMGTAMSRIDDGTYGTCERCGKPIDAARLRALPHASLCMDCKRREERAR